ncbi:MAG: YmdB family metallophosphoesterase, partial [Alphaproteobacteria bacterium]
MRLLFCGDVVGRPGREAVTQRIPVLRRTLGLDLVAVNGENAAAGFGITEAIARDFFAAGVDVITTGNHVWDKREIIATIAAEPRLLRPANFPRGTPGSGVGAYRLADGRRVVVVNLMTRLFMDALDCPFAAVDAALTDERLGETAAAILVDVHGEATSEKMAMGHHLDGRASAVVGSHSHVPTADAQVLPGGTAY